MRHAMGLEKHEKTMLWAKGSSFRRALTTWRQVIRRIGTFFNIRYRYVCHLQQGLWLFTLLMLKTNFLFVPKRCMRHFGLTWWRPAAQCFVCKECLVNFSTRSVRMQKRLRQGMRWDGLPGCLRDDSCQDWICCIHSSDCSGYSFGVRSWKCY